MPSILIIEDQADVSRMIAQALAGAGYRVAAAFTGPEGIEAARSGKPDLILLDLMLPYRSGDEVLREIRRFSDRPVIVVSARERVATKIDLLRLGADDYITKPFDLGELAARVESALRRARGSREEQPALRYRDLVLDGEAGRAAAGGVPLTLTAKEYRILRMLLEHPGKVFAKANLYESVWGEEYLGDDSAVKTHISNLRGKLRAAGRSGPYIETVWGLGYRLYGNGEQKDS